MKIISPSYSIESVLDGSQILKNIELIGRTCYKSEDKITDDSATKFVKKIINSKHDSVLEHQSMTVRFICSRAVSHELVRHRLCSFAQESQRYCNYKGGVEFINPLWNNTTDLDIWCNAVEQAEKNYLDLLEYGMSPQEAREVLPNSCKTEIVVTANLREWRHLLKLRVHNTAHPEMRRLMQPLLDELKELVPIIFDDITY